MSVTRDYQTPNNYHTFNLPSADVFVDIFSSLVVHLTRNRIAVVTQPTDAYFLGVAEALYDRATASNVFRAIPFIQLHRSLPIERVFQEL